MSADPRNDYESELARLTEELIEFNRKYQERLRHERRHIPRVLRNYE